MDSLVIQHYNAAWMHQHYTQQALSLASLAANVRRRLFEMLKEGYTLAPFAMKRLQLDEVDFVYMRRCAGLSTQSIETMLALLLDKTDVFASVIVRVLLLAGREGITALECKLAVKLGLVGEGPDASLVEQSFLDVATNKKTMWIEKATRAQGVYRLACFDTSVAVSLLPEVEKFLKECGDMVNALNLVATCV